MRTYSKLRNTDASTPSAMARQTRGESSQTSPQMTELQRTIGNRALLQSLRGSAEARGDAPLQTTIPRDLGESAAPARHAGLVVSRPGDADERQADRIADRVMRGPTAPGAQRMPAEDRPPQQAPQDAARYAPPIVGEALSQPGRPLDASVRSRMESGFGKDLSNVRIHTERRAAASARAVNANAYTVGRDIVFAEGAYRPETEQGQRLIAHELAHVGQQAAAGSRLQRDKPPGTPDPPVANIDAMLDQLSSEGAKPLGPTTRGKLREWAAEYARKRGEAVSIDQLRGALSRYRVYNTLPVIKSDAEVEAEKIKPPVPCNDIIPYKPGTKVLVTHLLDKILPTDKVGLLKSLAGGEQEKLDKPGANKQAPAQGSKSLEDIIRGNPSAVFDLIMSADVPKSATAVITASGPELVSATVDVPSIPAKGDLPAYEAFTATMTLRFDTFMGGYDLEFTRSNEGGTKTSFALHGLDMKKSGDTIQIGVGKDDYFKIRLSKGNNGELALQAFDINPIAKMLFGLSEPIALMNVTQTGETVAEVKRTENQVRSSYAPPPPTNAPKIYGGSGIQWTDRPEALFSAGWKFTFSPGLGLVKVPFAFQFDYAPRTDFFGGVYSGAEVVLPSKVPVRLSLIGGARVGSIETQGADGGLGPRTIVGGPVFGAGAGLRLSPSVEVQFDASYMLNLFRFGTGQGPSGVPGLGFNTIFNL